MTTAFNERKVASVTFTAEGIPSVTVLLDTTPVTIASGYGGWTVVSRQRRVGLTVWEGKDPLRMSIPVLFNGYEDGLSVEVPISHLSRMALPPTGGGEPPTVTYSSQVVPKPGPTVWVIENLQWGTNVLWGFSSNGVMARLRQDCVVNLLQYVADDRLALKNVAVGQAAGTGASKTGWPKRYTVATGDTLQKIAAKEYGDSGKWNKIATANGIRDGSSLKKGTVLTIPAP
jgi:hypothetical protein